MKLTVLKLGGELFEAVAVREHIASAIVSSFLPSLPSSASAPRNALVVVHGGGKAIDAELARRGIQPTKVDGLRITDADTLDAVIAVLAGSANTSLVAALVARGVKAVGLTGVDAGCGRATIAPPLRAISGEIVDLGLVGDPTEADPALFRKHPKVSDPPRVLAPAVSLIAGELVASKIAASSAYKPNHLIIP